MTELTVLPGGPATRLALISPDRAFRVLLADCLAEEARPVEWVLRSENELSGLRPEAVDQICDRGPDALFLDIGDDPLSGANFISAISARAPDLTVVAIGDSLDVDALLKVIRSGASGYLRRPFDRHEVAEACSTVLRKAGTKTGPQTAGHRARVLGLYSPKGGTGVSTLAANLAVHIRRATGKRTLLLDLTPELGTSPILLGLEPRYSYLDVLENLHRMDEGLLNTFLDEHNSGTRVLASPTAVFSSRELMPDSVSQLLGLLRLYFEYVVVDIGRGVMDRATLRALELSDERLILTTPDLPTLRNVKRVLHNLPTPEGGTEDGLRLVVSRYEEGVSVERKDIERAVGLPLRHVLAEDREGVSKSVNLGRPIVLNGSSPYSTGVGRIGNLIAKDDLLEKDDRGPLGKLLGAMLPPFGSNNGKRAITKKKKKSEPRSARRTAQGSGVA